MNAVTLGVALIAAGLVLQAVILTLARRRVLRRRRARLDALHFTREPVAYEDLLVGVDREQIEWEWPSWSPRLQELTRPRSLPERTRLSG